ncbi:MAG: iron-containing alcohol dehydrogenase [archaeon]
MENFIYECKTKIIFGRNTETQVGEETKKFGRKILLLYGSGSIKKNGLYGRVIDSLKNAGLVTFELGGVIPNPTMGLVYDGIKLCRGKNIDFILAVGGGSVIDSAKAIACGFYYEGDAWDFFSKQVEITKALPIGTILTIPAAGSEASPNSVITHSGRKLAIGSDILRPVFSILNPELNFTLPMEQTIAGIADMYAHIVERYFTNTGHVDLTDKLCEATMRSIIKNARILVKNPNDYDARAEILWASTIAHCGILGTGREEDWASHRIEHELSALYNITHGTGLAIIVPAWMEFVCKHDRVRFNQYAKEVFNEDTAEEGINSTAGFFREIGLPATLKEISIGHTDFEKMAELATQNGELGSFVKLGKNDVVEIYRKAEK